MERQRKVKSRKKKQFPVKIAAAVAGMLVLTCAATMGIYIKKGQSYQTIFFPNTIINGMDVSEKTVEEVKSLIASGIDGYTLTLKERGGHTETITKEEIALHSVFDGSLEKLLEAQDPMKWWSHRTEVSNYDIQTMIAYDEALLQQKMDSLQCFAEDFIQAPTDAYRSDYITGEGYKIIPETPGNRLVKETVATAITEAIQDLKEEISLEQLDAYIKPGITAADPGLQTVVSELNKQVGVTVKYQFGDRIETLSGETTHHWMSVNADQTIALDKDQVAAYVKSLASKYNTAYQKKNLKTSYGKTVVISGGFYGFKINQGAEADELYRIIRAGESQTREPIYSQKGASHGANDYGETDVEIHLTAQHLFFYKNGKLIQESDFVSGNLAKKHDTPPGAYALTYKERNATLKGENYATPVSYWMPFNGNIGMHDAGWRSSFGGSIYKTGGSHGCVNLPPAAAKTIFENIEKGIPVLCYYLEGTEAKP
ncbi:MAG: L,D-transpeptidase family protein, partial [Hungatella sp.]